PRIIVRGADEAIAFYSEAFLAELLERYEDDSGAVVHAALRLGKSIFSLAEENSSWKMTPPCLETVSHLLHLSVPDPDSTCRAAVARGAQVISPIEDRDYGKREGRVRDPFGHCWILSCALKC